jgi:hypothetical protein
VRTCFEFVLMHGTRNFVTRCFLSVTTKYWVFHDCLPVLGLLLQTLISLSPLAPFRKKATCVNFMTCKTCPVFSKQDSAQWFAGALIF